MKYLVLNSSTTAAISSVSPTFSRDSTEFALPVAFAFLFDPLRRFWVGTEALDHLIERPTLLPAQRGAQPESGSAARFVASYILRLPGEVRPGLLDQPPKIRNGNAAQLRVSLAPSGDGEISMADIHLDRRRVRRAASLERSAGLPTQQRLHRRQVGREREYLDARLARRHFAIRREPFDYLRGPRCDIPRLGSAAAVEIDPDDAHPCARTEHEADAATETVFAEKMSMSKLFDGNPREIDHAM